MGVHCHLTESNENYLQKKICKKKMRQAATNVSDFDPDMKAFLTEEFLVDAEDPHTDTVLTEVESNGGEGRKMCGAAAAGYAGSQY